MAHTLCEPGGQGSFQIYDNDFFVCFTSLEVTALDNPIYILPVFSMEC